MIRPNHRASVATLASLTALLLMLAGCGGSDEKKASRPQKTPVTSTSASPTSSPSESEHDATCRKLGRTWVVSAEDLRVDLTLPTYDQFQEVSRAMKDATDQMEIEQCAGEIRSLATKGNFELSLLAFDVMKCEQQGGYDPCPAGAKWQRKGEPLVTRVEELSSD